jgi:competence protein ComEC
VRADVVFIPHHGSEGSSDPLFIARRRTPRRAGLHRRGNRFGHPRSEVVAVGARPAHASSTPAAGAPCVVDVGLEWAENRRTSSKPTHGFGTERPVRHGAGLCYRGMTGLAPEE